MTGITTLTHKEELKNYLELLKDSLYKKKNYFENTLENKIPTPYREIIKSRLLKQGIEFTQHAKIKDLLTNLLKEVKELKLMSLTLAFKPSESSIGNIEAWINKNLKQDYILDIKVNPLIIGGALISAKGKYSDQSLRKKITRISIKNVIKEYYGNI